MVVEVPLSGKRGAGLFALVDARFADEVRKTPWHFSHGGAAGRVEGRQRIFLHNYILDLAGVRRGPHTDHIDGDRLNNTLANLRPATCSQNLANARKHRDAVSSAYKGVCWHAAGTGWMAQITHRKVNHYLGTFLSEEDAALAYNRKARELHGEFARLNPIEDCGRVLVRRTYGYRARARAARQVEVEVVEAATPTPHAA